MLTRTQFYTTSCTACQLSYLPVQLQIRTSESRYRLIPVAAFPFFDIITIIGRTGSMSTQGLYTTYLSLSDATGKGWKMTREEMRAYGRGMAVAVRRKGEEVFIAFNIERRVIPEFTATIA